MKKGKNKQPDPLFDPPTENLEPSNSMNKKKQPEPMENPLFDPPTRKKKDPTSKKSDKNAENASGKASTFSKPKLEKKQGYFFH